MTINATDDNRTLNNTARHQYRVLTDAEKDTVTQFKDLEVQFTQLLSSLGDKREYALALTNIQQATMWAVRGVTA